jgi:bifunctional non-homologous end joining protein LigD
VLDERGISRFQLLQNIQRKKTAPPLYYVFDILWLNEKDLRELPLSKRRENLKKLLKKKKLFYIKLSEAIEEKGVSFFRAAKKLGLEGIMAKRAESPYRSSRSSDWLKIKTGFRQEVVIGGFTAPKGSRKLFGALLIGVYKKGKLSYVGHVGGGFDQKLLEEVFTQLKKRITKISPFAETPHPNAPVTWVKPELVCEVAFAEWTADGKMRQPIFKGLRFDKEARKVVRE